eukprot:TRINITY_DN3915_c0_g1_i1.p1 TRINITY_DN3915_c0_g1~~TRINITY_DN3915_c0_g1_i1.p1  ORF type:complete len:144 (-),score=11.13 TRINITY_DN3915_c0_g1_i1:79-510(-)
MHKRVKDQKTLQSSALVCQLPDPVQHQINNLLSNSIVSSCIVVGGILLPSDHLLRMEELAVSSSANFINDGWLCIDKYSPRNMLARTSLCKEVLNESSPPPAFCQMASGHQAVSHAPGSTVPSRRYQSGPRLDQHGWRYTHAW